MMCIASGTYAIPQAVSSRFLNVGTKVKAPGNPCGICGGRRALGQGFLWVMWVSLVNAVPPLFHIRLRMICGMENRPVTSCSTTKT
jgi:hypothetical protein